MILAAILFFGILTQWVPARWPVTAFQLALFALALYEIIRRKGAISLNPIGALLAAAAGWGILQIATHHTVYEVKTVDAVILWVTNLTAFALARQARAKILQAILIFAFLLGIAATFTVLTSPNGKIFWIFESGTGLPTLGPFVYRNQYGAFIEAVLPFAILQAILDRRRSVLYIAIAATMLASVIAGGSRTGSILCLAEILITPVLAFSRRMIDGRTVARVLAVSVAAIVALTLVVGWETIWNRLQEPNPYSLRADLVRSSLEMVRARPLLGFGLGTWATAYPAYAHFDDGSFVNQAHNDWIQWTAEGGIPFLAIMADHRGAHGPPSFALHLGHRPASRLHPLPGRLPNATTPRPSRLLLRAVGSLDAGQERIRTTRFPECLRRSIPSVAILYLT